MTSDSILIVGTGAMATLFAARMAAAGVEVTVLGTWQTGLEALRTHGARLDGDQKSYPVHAAENPAECRGARAALVLVKSWQTDCAAQRLRECLAEDGLALTLQNGLGNVERLASWLGQERTGLGVTTLGAALLAPGIVRPGGEGVISLERKDRLDPLAALLRRAGFTLEIVEDASSIVWGKLVVNAAINPLSALLRVPNGELLSRAEARSLMGEAAREAAQVARALNVELPFEDPIRAVEEVARRTGSNRSSMLQDIERGARTEVDAINGAVVRLGKENGVATPVNGVLYSLLRSLALPS